MAKTPGLAPFVTREYPSAICTPTRSCRQIIGRIPAWAAASIIDVVGKQLKYSIPCAFNVFAIASIVFMLTPSAEPRC